MAKALKCDRCGQFYDLLTEFRNYRIRDLSEPIKYEKYVDLCPDCYAELLLFLNLYNESGEFEEDEKCLMENIKT